MLTSLLPVVISVSATSLQTGLLQPLPIHEFRWQSVPLNLITDLPRTKEGQTTIVVFVDRLSKMVHFALAWTDMGSQEFAQIFMGYPSPL